MRRIILAAIGLVLAIVMVMGYAHNKAIRRSDPYIRNRVLMITGNGMQCTAIEIKAPSGKLYTLSAAHCSGMIVRAQVQAEAEDGSKKMLEFIAIDPEHDLLLLSAFNDKSIDVAKHDKKYERVHTLTHGHGMPTYRTDGFLLSDKIITIVEPIYSEEGMVECVPTPYQDLVFTVDGIGCKKTINLTMATAQVVPGSSGGPAVNDAGELVGIVSVTDGFFSGFVPLHDIHMFLKSR